MRRSLFVSSLVSLLLVAPLSQAGAASPGPLRAAEPAVEESDWAITLTPYVFMAGLDGTLGFDGGSAPVVASFGDILSALDVAFFGAAEVRYRRISAFVDINYTATTVSESLETPLFDSVKVGNDILFGTAGVAYRFQLDNGVELAPYIGARWWNVDLSVDLRPGLSPSQSFAFERGWADPVFGLSVDYAITDRWFVGVLGDVGGGVSDLTWQVYGRGGYQFNDLFALTLGYRYVGVDYDRDGFEFDTLVDGLMLGFRFSL